MKTNHCKTSRCRGITTESGHSPYCAKCRYRRWRDKFPLHCSYNNLKKRAKERGKDFTLTREQYVEFATKTDYAKMKGKTSLSLSINRKDNSQGYHYWNIEAITLSENSRKLFTNMPDWMKDEIRALELGHIPESHRNLSTASA
jgi:hypothetical protein